MPKNSRRNRRKKRKASENVSSILVPKEREKNAHGGPLEFSQQVEEANKIAADIAKAHAERITEEIVKYADPEPSSENKEKMREIIEKEKLDSLMEEAYRGKREPKAEGGMPEEETPMAMPPEIEQAIQEESPEDQITLEETPLDTYTPEDQINAEITQLPDEQIEEDYIEFILNKALIPEEQEYLMNVLEADPQLSQIFDKVVDSASEFSGVGEVTGPGDGVSDSIPARLSDGEFVISEKATEQLGATNLQTMMDDAERAYGGGIMRKDRYLGGIMTGDEEELRLENEDSTDAEIRKLMSIKANKTPSLR